MIPASFTFGIVSNSAFSPPEITPARENVSVCSPPDGIVMLGLNVKMVVAVMFGAVTVTEPAGTELSEAVSVNELKIAGRLTVTLMVVMTC
jgi:hypothetical protein